MIASKKLTRAINVGGVLVGGGNPVSVQSMCTTDTKDALATVKQILALEEAGCEIVRVAVPDSAAAKAVKDIVSAIHIPLVADIHFNHLLAIESLEAGAACARINPGNIGGKERALEAAEAARSLGCALRIGVNSGSIEKDLLEKYGPTPEALTASALRNSDLMEEAGFTNYKVSIKASSAAHTVKAYTEFSKHSAAPLHIGVTEAGTARMGIIKSAAGIGALLLSGIGDTLRVSLTADPLLEVRAGFDILSACDLRKRGAEIISCPTCGRTDSAQVIRMAEAAEEALRLYKGCVKVAVMGCAVNGPGEAREADIGLACGKREALLFSKGEIVKKVPIENALEELLKLLSV